MDAEGHPSPASGSAAVIEGLALHGISPRLQPQHYDTGTPLGSPTKLNLSMMGQYRHHNHHYPPPPQVGGAGLPTLENLMPMASLDQFLADRGYAKLGGNVVDDDQLLMQMDIGQSHEIFG
ncbi:unnamed protein product [Triticum turgidum subsp. durum]|uniref:Uncharacterized protein n=1 Tax=Triticum turgidum subsp. durum TaxID=4567 RepID=A0A9R1QVI9_TRITD|nr:unnamed protein product [Triticum turgidum subsp. durum]